MYLRQSTASQTRLTPRFVDDTDFKTPETGLTIANTDVKLSKNGAASANKNSGGGTHIEGGRYALTFDATDTNTVGELAAGINVAGALPVEFKFFVLEEAVYDQLFAASATGAVPSVTGAVGSVTGNVGGNVTGSVGSVATGGITAASFAADAITAAKVAADVGTEIGTAVWATAARTLTANTNLNDLDAAGVRAAVGLASANLDTQIATLATAAALDTVDNLLDTEIAALTTAVADLPTNAELATALGTADDAVLAAIAGLNDLGAADVRSAVGLSSANLDTQLSNIDTVADSIKAKTDSLTFTTAGMVDSAVKRVGTTTLAPAGTGGQGYGS